MARVTNFFLVYASAAIAMLGLRAMFFVGVLGKLFSLMDQLLSSLMDQMRATTLSVFHLQVYTSAAVPRLPRNVLHQRRPWGLMGQTRDDAVRLLP